MLTPTTATTTTLALFNLALALAAIAVAVALFRDLAGARRQVLGTRLSGRTPMVTNRAPHVCLSGTGPDGRPYLTDAPERHEARMEEINHVFWVATGREFEAPPSLMAGKLEAPHGV